MAGKSDAAALLRAAAHGNGKATRGLATGKRCSERGGTPTRRGHRHSMAKALLRFATRRLCDGHQSGGEAQPRACNAATALASLGRAKQRQRKARASAAARLGRWTAAATLSTAALGFGSAAERHATARHDVSKLSRGKACLRIAARRQSPGSFAMRRHCEGQLWLCGATPLRSTPLRSTPRLASELQCRARLSRAPALVSCGIGERSSGAAMLCHAKQRSGEAWRSNGKPPPRFAPAMRRPAPALIAVRR